MTAQITVTSLGSLLTSGNVLALSLLEGGAGKVPYFTGVGALALADSTEFGRSLLDTFSAGALQTLVQVAPLVEGREYLGAFYRALIDGDDPITVVLSGDSTTRGTPYTTDRYAPQALMGDLTRRRGVSGPVYTALGRSGATSADWLETYLTEDMAYAPKLYVWHWGINDPVPAIQDLTPEETRDNLRAGLEAIRADYSRDEMAILILTPNMSDATATGRTPAWFSAINEYYRDAARDYECCFIDIYTPWKNADATMMFAEMSGLYVHPGPAMSAVTWGQVADVLLPEGLRRPAPPQIEPNVVERRFVSSSTWLSSDGGATTSFRSVCWASDFARFVAVGATGTGQRVVTSDDGVTWTARTSAADDNWKSVCYSPQLQRLVAVASNGSGSRVMSSDDGGVTWTARTANAAAQWLGACWSPDRRLFVIVGTVGSVMTSPDGVTWTARTAAATNSWQAVCWSRTLGLFCAIASSGTGDRAMYSYDGIDWSAGSSAADKTWIGICASDELGLFVAVANDSGGNNVMTSPDGETWTLRAGDSNPHHSVVYAPELGAFAAVGVLGTGDRVMYSTDGIDWTTGASAADNGWQAVCWAPELRMFCAVSSDGTGNNAMTSVSGLAYPYRS